MNSPIKRVTPPGFLVVRGIMQLCCPHCGSEDLQILGFDLLPILPLPDVSLVIRCAQCIVEEPAALMECLIRQRPDGIEIGWTFNSPLRADIVDSLLPRGGS